MKSILLFLFGLLCGVQSFAQNGALYQIWYLTSYEYSSDSFYNILDITPRTSPYLEIDQDLGFTGIICNEYAGLFSYDSSNDHLILDDFSPCLCGTCNNPPQSHVDFENAYFDMFFESILEPVAYTIIYETPGDESLILEFATGNKLYYQNYPLSISKQNLVQFDVYPNPVSDQLFISSENLQIERISIYSMSGKEVRRLETKEKSIDVSRLHEGIYFIEVTSLNGKSIQKFVKQ